jgi:hypothetical protein
MSPRSTAHIIPPAAGRPDVAGEGVLDAPADSAVLDRVRGPQGAPSRLGHVHAYQTTSSRRTLSTMLKNQ